MINKYRSVKWKLEPNNKICGFRICIRTRETSLFYFCCQVLYNVIGNVIISLVSSGLVDGACLSFGCPLQIVMPIDLYALLVAFRSGCFFSVIHNVINMKYF